jgi:hypothetical protein
MNNKDMPAMPQPIAANENEFLDTNEYSKGNSGLTKRDHFAGLAMQGLCHAIDSQGTWAHDAETVAGTAVRYADALLVELDKANQND